MESRGASPMRPSEVFLKPLKWWDFPHTDTDRSGVSAAPITLYSDIVFSSATKCDQSSHRAPTARCFSFGRYYCCTHVTRLPLNMPRHLAYASQPNVLAPVSLNLLLSLIL